MFRKYAAAAAFSAAMIVSMSASADEAQSDRIMTFSIPSHAMQSYVATLSDKSDFSVFVDKDCPPELQQMALRRLWKMLPSETSESAFN